MTINHHQEHIDRIKKMSFALIIPSVLCGLVVYLLPDNENFYWFSKTGKQGFYVLSSLFIFLGAICLGSIWRKNHFL